MSSARGQEQTANSLERLKEESPRRIPELQKIPMPFPESTWESGEIEARMEFSTEYTSEEDDDNLDDEEDEGEDFP